MRRRKKIRLKDYNYFLDGLYYTTICKKNREYIFGDIIDNEIYMNQYKDIVQSCWNKLPEHYPTILLDEFVVMPNHVHGIIIIVNDFIESNISDPYIVGAGLRPAPTTITKKK